MIPPEGDYAIEVFFDGGCPLCVREMGLLRRWDRRQRIRFVDIDAPGFEAGRYAKTQEELMARMHGRLPDGTWLQGVEVFRRLYSELGFAPVVALSRLPGVSQLLDGAYWLFASNRLRLAGRCGGGTCAAPSRSRLDNTQP